MVWGLREAPGLVLAGCYLFAGILFAYWLFRRGSRATPFWRRLRLMLLLQIAALVPMKVLMHWVFNLKYLIYIPEYWANV
jgi:hypothetical protein